jgi:hypothetical protein
MNIITNKIIFIFLTFLFFSSCNTIENKEKIFKAPSLSNDSLKLQQNSALNESEQKIKNEKRLTSPEMAPIKTPVEKPKVKTLILNKKIKLPKRNRFNFNSIKNFSETDLIKKIGKSSFIKQEGKLKNYQYYFTKCFLDVFLINKNNNFYVNLVKARPTKLNGKLNINDCLEEIEKKLN